MTVVAVLLAMILQNSLLSECLPPAWPSHWWLSLHCLLHIFHIRFKKVWLDYLRCLHQAADTNQTTFSRPMNENIQLWRLLFNLLVLIVLVSQAQTGARPLTQHCTVRQQVGHTHQLVTVSYSAY